jgi:tRNA 2-thiouridine synthesizing protein D
MSKKVISVALMDPPYESENLTTAFRILDAAARRGYDLNVFAYEGASALAFAKQVPHPNPVHGKTIAEASGGNVDWVNCGMCVDERGVGEFLPGTRRGGPADFHAFVEKSDNVLVIPTK